MKTKPIIISTLVMLLLAACSKDDKINDEGVPFMVRFNSLIVATQTRTTDGGNQWVTDDPVGIYMVNHGETLAAESIAEEADNRQYKAIGSNTADTGFNPAESNQTIFYPQNGDKVDFVAYYPYRQDITEHKYAVDVSDQSAPAAIDLLYAKTNNDGEGYNKQSGQVTLPFRHPLSKLAITVAAGNGIVSLEGLRITINGMNTTADFNLAQGELSNQGNPNYIQPYNVNGSNTYEAILLPINTLSADHYVEFELDDIIYKWQINLPDNALEAGKKYAYTITITGKGVEGATGNIDSWDEQPEGTGNTREPKK
ncbi:fimbrillin family protein [Limibacterium fermenti]|uniref:fimbrillin family protein n=1 Tax=Limibacterium fermenti TaxID=3229863 RepID=UPI003A79B73B